jgi:hypothetical protein
MNQLTNQPHGTDFSPSNYGLKSLLLAAATFALITTAHADDNAIPLFDGKSLDGWVTAGGEPVTTGWTVEDGMLVRTSRGGSIYTAKEYGNFDLSFEWKIAPRGNSGIKYRVAHYKKGVYGNPGWLGCEYQIYDDIGRGARPRYSSGAIYELYAPRGDKKLRPVGEFNQARIVVDGTKIEHWLNGVRIVDADTSSDEWKRRVGRSKFGDVEGFFANRKGRIELQDHGAKVWFRNMLLRPLDSASGTP